jgi:hypothetical protein
MNAYKRYNYIYLGIYIFVFFSLTNVLALFASLMGVQGGTLEELETKRAPSFCRSEGAFLSVERKQICLCIFTIINVVF